MAKYIEREALLKAIDTSLNNNPHENRLVAKTHNDEHRHFLSMVLAQPTADVVEVKHGEWIEHFNFDCWHYDCPFCDFGFATQIRNEDTPNYCENCGAKMDLKEGAEE